MVFHSLLFIGVFLPVVLIGFEMLARFAGRRAALSWLLLASLFFYAWPNPQALSVLFISAAINYMAGQALTRKPTRPLFVAAVSADVLLLVFFKYAPAWPGHPLPLAWPLGLSFYTFSQLAYLTDAFSGLGKSYRPADYLLFVSFFPYVNSGPITSHSEALPQFETLETQEPLLPRLAIGLTLFTVGLFKKAVLADGIAAYVHPVFGSAATGTSITFVEAWLGALSFAFSLYFDFSGYSDMALGVARLFGIELPFNFNSPYQAVNIIDFWRRWHMTLTRFLTNYIYNPIALTIIRARSQQGKAVMKSGRGTLGAFLMTIAFPSCVTMALVGAWHGTGWTYLVFGLLHGIYLSIAHAWHAWKKSWSTLQRWPTALRIGTARLFTCLGVLVSFVFFRAASISAALNILAGMVGRHGVAMPVAYATFFSRLPIHGMSFPLRLLVSPKDNLAWIAVLSAIVWCAPNSQEWVGLEASSSRWAWRPSVGWALACGVMATAALWCVMSVNHPTDFIYFQF